MDVSLAQAPNFCWSCQRNAKGEGRVSGGVRGDGGISNAQQTDGRLIDQ